jgi:serine-type D-Ala-D-Ala carboxypeptidase/endopeptidase (penicillin-binding protein 4)
MKTLLPFGLIAVWVAAPVPAQAGQEPSQSAATQADAATMTAGAPASLATAVPPPPDAATAALRRDIAEILRRPRWTNDQWGVMVVSLDRGDTLFAHAPAESLAPASNMKLFTTAAALYYLGPDYRYNTFLMTAGPIRDGVLEGDLIVYGTGDPTFSERFGDRLAVWQSFADTLAALGVREVRGAVLGDGSYFEGPGAGEGWRDSYMNASYAASAGALSFAENVAMLQISPAEQVGWRPTVRLVPGGEGIAVVNQATTVGGGATRISARRVAYDGPIIVTGQIGSSARPVLRSVPVSDPARFAAAMFREVLSRNDIVVTGGVRSAVTREESPVTGRSVFAPALDSQEPLRVLAIHTSPPISRILEIINKRSHNLMAEQVLRTVGRVAVGVGSVAGGERAVRHMMENEGGIAEALAVYDGSGLSVLNRSSAGEIVSLLTVMANSPRWNDYWETLPEAGARDGLSRMQRTGAEGNLRAKTGTIDRVSALSGYVTAGNGERLAFSIISNNVPSTWMAKRVEDAIGARLAEFERPRLATGATAADRTAVSPDRATPAPPTLQRAGEPEAGAETPAPAPPADTATVRTHVIRSGDTLDALARRYGVTVRELEAANPGLDPRRLIPGRSIRIPG